MNTQKEAKKTTTPKGNLYNKLSTASDIITAETVQRLGENIAVRAVKTILDKCAGTEKTAQKDGAKLQGGIYPFMHKMYVDLVRDITAVNLMPKAKQAVTNARNALDSAQIKVIQATTKKGRTQAKNKLPPLKKALETAENDLIEAQKQNIQYAYTDSYDIVQTATAFLCGYIGQKIDDISQEVNKKGQPLTNKSGQPVTILRACFRAVNNYVMENRTKVYKVTYLEDTDGATYEIPKFWDMPTITDYKQVTEKIRQMNLTERQDKILRYRLQGLSVIAISKKLGISKQSVSKTILTQIQPKYQALKSE